MGFFGYENTETVCGKWVAILFDVVPIAVERKMIAGKKQPHQIALGATRRKYAIGLGGVTDLLCGPVDQATFHQRTACTLVIGVLR
ncbi:hypothetical protein D3C87_1082460 [compost metagenome]